MVGAEGGDKDDEVEDNGAAGGAGEAEGTAIYGIQVNTMAVGGAGAHHVVSNPPHCAGAATNDIHTLGASPPFSLYLSSCPFLTHGGTKRPRTHIRSDILSDFIHFSSLLTSAERRASPLASPPCAEPCPKRSSTGPCREAATADPRRVQKATRMQPDAAARCNDQQSSEGEAIEGKGENRGEKPQIRDKIQLRLSTLCTRDLQGICSTEEECSNVTNRAFRP